MTRCTNALIALLLMPGSAMAFLGSSETPPPATPRPVASILVTDDLPVSYSIPGAISARLEVALGFQTLGRITTRDADIGDVVTKGQILATLDPEDLHAQVISAAAAADAARVDLLTAKSSAARVKALAERNVATTAQLEQAERAVAAAEAADQKAKSELIQAQDSKNYAQLRAPFDGVISQVQANPGTVVIAGEPVMQLSAQDGLEAVIDMPAATLAHVRVGDGFEVWSESQPETRQLAQVLRVDPVADAATRTRRVRLKLASDKEFRMGALIRARPTSRGTRQIVLPAAAIVQKEGHSYVWVVTRQGRQGTVALRHVRSSGPQITDMVSIDCGVQPGEEVVIRGVQSLQEGQVVGERVQP